MCVRFGPTMPTDAGLPLIVWHPMHADELYVLNPATGSPFMLMSNVSSVGRGVCGVKCAGSLSFGNTYPVSTVAVTCGVFTSATGRTVAVAGAAALAVAG